MRLDKKLLTLGIWIGVMLMAFAACTVAETDPSSLGPSIMVKEIVNHVEVNGLDPNTNNPAFVELELGQSLFPGNRIKTHRDSEARVDISIDQFTRISRTSPETVWHIGGFTMDGGAIIELQEGKIFVFDEDNGDEHWPLHVVTPAGTASARGTWLAVGFDPETGVAEVECFRGVCELENDHGYQVITDEQSISATVDTMPTEPVPMDQETIESFQALPEAKSEEVPVPVQITPDQAKVKQDKARADHAKVKANEAAVEAIEHASQVQTADNEDGSVSAQAVAPGQIEDGSAKAAAPGQIKDGTAKAVAPGQIKDDSAKAAAPGQTKDPSAKAAAPGQTKDRSAKAAAPGQTKDGSARAAAPGSQKSNPGKNDKSGNAFAKGSRAYSSSNLADFEEFEAKVSNGNSGKDKDETGQANASNGNSGKDKDETGQANASNSNSGKDKDETGQVNASNGNSGKDKDETGQANASNGNSGQANASNGNSGQANASNGNSKTVPESLDQQVLDTLASLGWGESEVESFMIGLNRKSPAAQEQQLGKLIKLVDDSDVPEESAVSDDTDNTTDEAGTADSSGTDDGTTGSSGTDDPINSEPNPVVVEDPINSEPNPVIVEAPPNTLPVAVADSATKSSGPGPSFIDINVLTNDSDADSDSMTVTNLTQPANGSVSLVAGKARYTPDSAFTGDDTFTYTANDGTGDSNVVTVTVTVEAPPNTLPVAVADSATKSSGPGPSFIDINVLTNDSDADSDSMTVTNLTQPANGSVSLVAGKARYTPDSAFTGDDTFTYTANDGTGDSNVVTVTVTVTVEAPPNTLPVAVDDSATKSGPGPSFININVLSNDSDADSDSVTVTNLTQPANGSASVNANNTVKYTPDSEFTGDDTFTYTANDGTGDSNVATVTVTVS